MGNLNQCNFVGRLGEEPEQKSFPDGTAVCNISIAVSKKFKDKQTDEYKEFTHWPHLVFTGRLAEILCQYTKKGDRIRVTTEYRVRKWQTNEGEHRYAHEFVVREVELLEGARSSSDRTNQPYQKYGQQGHLQPSHQRQQHPPVSYTQAPRNFQHVDDDIPF